MTKLLSYHLYRFSELFQLYYTIILQVISYTTNQNVHLYYNYEKYPLSPLKP